MINPLHRIFILMIGCVVLAACQTVPDAIPDDPHYAPVQQHQLMAPMKRNGSIFQSGFSKNLWTDQRARRVGDVITVVLEENTTSTKSHATSISKDTDVNTEAPSIFGASPNINAADVFGNSVSDLNFSTSIDSSRAFSGNADADQSNSLSGRLTVTVSEVLPNGLLRVRGEKWLTLSRGEEYLRIKGLVRQVDIQPDNTILSSQIADARITYSGTGEFAEVNRQGWLAKIFNSRYWPF